MECGSSRQQRARAERRRAAIIGLLTVFLLLWPALASARSIEEDAEAFGTMPAAWGVELSPSGRYLSYLSMHASDIPFAVVLDLENGGASSPIASQPGVHDLNWCGWATDDRLVCGYFGVTEQMNIRMALTRLVAVDRDGENMRNLVRQSRQFLGKVTDWMPDDPKRIMVPYEDEETYHPDANILGVAALDIHTTRSDWVKRPRKGFSGWGTDGRGELRLRTRHEPDEWVWEAKAVGSSEWQRVGSREKDVYRGVIDEPEGFLDDPNHLVVRRLKGGREALYVRDLSGETEDKLLFAHDDVDVGELVTMGPERRAVGVRYVTDRPRVHYFDDRILEIIARAEKTFPDMQIDIWSESSDRRYYVVLAQSDDDPGSFYRLDAEQGNLIRIRPRHPKLEGVDLARMRAFEYPARDGTTVPAYVTLPPGKRAKPLPTIVLPHGGPESRDRWGFDWLAQFLAARGYLVLQANYRGSGGYGVDWAGEGGFRNWALAMSDIEDGIANLVERGVADPDRVCIVGWSYGGYAALMSVIEHPDRYRCAVSIAGVGDLGQLVDDSRNFTNKRIARDQIGDDEEERRKGSPRRRVKEIPVPVLLFHGENDFIVYVEHSKKLAKAMKKAGKPVELVIYDDTEHSLDRNGARVDMLTRIGHFLEDHLEKPKAAAGN